MTADCKLVIFDCDGVLVDSEKITIRVLTGMLNRLGLAVVEEDMFKCFVGKSIPQCTAIIGDMLERPAPEEFWSDFHLLIVPAMESSLQPVPGIKEVLDGLALPYCVASNGTHAKMRTTLGITGLLPFFEGKRFCVEDVTRGKPAPDLFLHAAAAFGAPPAACVVVEDTATGVRAGVAAGMTVFGYAALTPAEQLLEAGAHAAFDDMTRLPSLINQRFGEKTVTT
jgi:HAD superfamily hydrolase (TIGR01509 family)